MNTLQLNTASLNDIVFEGRNQSYGAYVLRRIYSRHLVTGLTLSVLLCLVLVSIPILVQRLWPAMVIVPAIPVEGVVTMTDVDLTPREVAPPAQLRHAVVVTPRYEVPTTIVKDPLNKAKDEVEALAPTDPNAINGPVAMDGTTSPVVTGPAAAPGIDSNAAVVAPTAAPFLHAEVMPEFAGGLDALRQYLQHNMKYPRPALASGISGTVFVAFTVQASGAISDVEVLKGLGYGTEEEALRVVKNMPAWTPGRQNNHTVAVRYTLPITFRYE